MTASGGIRDQGFGANVSRIMSNMFNGAVMSKAGAVRRRGLPWDQTPSSSTHEAALVSCIPCGKNCAHLSANTRISSRFASKQHMEKILDRQLIQARIADNASLPARDGVCDEQT